MAHNPQQHRLKHLVESSGILAPYINDIFDAAQKKADSDDEQTACGMLDAAQEVLFEFKKLQILSGIHDEITNRDDEDE